MQVDQRMELSDSQLEEIADQAHIHPKAFLGMISFINKYLEGKTVLLTYRVLDRNLLRVNSRFTFSILSLICSQIPSSYILLSIGA